MLASQHFSAHAFRNGQVVAVDACSGRSFARHSHDEFGVGVIASGAQRSWSGRGSVEAGQGHLITVNPGEVHDGSPIGGQRTWSMLYVDPAIVGEIVADVSDGKIAMRELHAPVVRDAGLACLFTSTRAAVGDDECFGTSLTLLFGALLGGTRESVGPVPPRLALARERIDDDPTASHPLAELASLAGMGRYQFLRGFATMTGLTPHRYVVQRRLELARGLIRTGAELADAAAAAGFADQSHLHRLFVARYGMTPGAYAGALGR